MNFLKVDHTFPALESGNGSTMLENETLCVISGSKCISIDVSIYHRHPRLSQKLTVALHDRYFFTNRVGPRLVNIWNSLGLPNGVVLCDTVYKFKSYLVKF